MLVKGATGLYFQVPLPCRLFVHIVMLQVHGTHFAYYVTTRYFVISLNMLHQFNETKRYPTYLI